MVKEENTAWAKKAIADPKFKAAQLKINALNVGKVFDQDINTGKVKFDTKLDALFLVVELSESPAEQIKKSPCASTTQDAQQVWLGVPHIDHRWHH